MTGMRIDVHNHYLGGTVGEMLARGPALTGGFTLPPWTVESALHFMDAHDIGTAVLSVPFEPPARLGAAATARFASTVNAEIAAVVAARPDRFGGFATLPLTTTDSAISELTHALDDLGMDGVVLHSNADGRYFGQEWYEPLLAELGRRSAPTFVHPADCPGIDRLGFGRPSSVIEFPMDTARNVVNAIYSGVFLRNPGLRLILAHAGGVLPTLAWRISEHLANGRGPADDDAVTKEHIASVLRDLYYDTAIAPSAHSLLPLLECTSSSHLLFGSDWPAAPEYAVTDADEEFGRFPGLSDAAKAGVGRAHAEALFPRLAAIQKR